MTSKKSQAEPGQSKKVISLSSTFHMIKIEFGKTIVKMIIKLSWE